MQRITFLVILGIGLIIWCNAVAHAAPQDKQAPQVPTAPQSAPQTGLPDKRTRAEGQDAMRKLDKAVAPYVARAKKTWPDAKARFWKGLPKGQTLYVTYRLRENKGKQQETVFVAVKSINTKTSLIVGKIANILATVRTFKTGQWVKFSEVDLLDWTITRPDGTEEGNVVGKFLDSYKP